MPKTLIKVECFDGSFCSFTKDDILDMMDSLISGDEKYTMADNLPKWLIVAWIDEFPHFPKLIPIVINALDSIARGEWPKKLRFHRDIDSFIKGVKGKDPKDFLENSEN